jgi:hypothetical protein
MGTSRSASWRTRLVGFLAALALAAGVLIATTTPASAGEPNCDQDPPLWPHNACLTVDFAGGNSWAVRVGYDGYMAKWYADALLACPNGPQIFATVWAYDPGRANVLLGHVPLVAPPSSGDNPTGLFADFFSPGMNLDEDAGQDEVFAEITYLNCYIRYGWITHETGMIQAYF